MTFGLRNLFPTAAVDVVGVYDDAFNQLFDDARPIKASVKEESTFFKHPLENSTTRVDHIVRDPIEINLVVVVSGDGYSGIYKNIKQIYLDQTSLMVQTRTDTYANMFIQGMPHDETPDTFDAVIISLNLVETLLTTTTVTFSPANASDSNTKNRGQTLPKTPNNSQIDKSSTLKRIFG